MTGGTITVVTASHRIDSEGVESALRRSRRGGRGCGAGVAARRWTGGPAGHSPDRARRRSADGPARTRARQPGERAVSRAARRHDGPQLPRRWCHVRAEARRPRPRAFDQRSGARRARQGTRPHRRRPVAIVRGGQRAGLGRARGPARRARSARVARADDRWRRHRHSRCSTRCARSPRAISGFRRRPPRASRICFRPTASILVTGPGGSGRAATLYSFLRRLHATRPTRRHDRAAGRAYPRRTSARSKWIPTPRRRSRRGFARFSAIIPRSSLSAKSAMRRRRRWPSAPSKAAACSSAR